MLNWSASHKYQLLHHWDVWNWSVLPVRRRKKVSNWSVLLTYQLRSHEDVSVWSRTFKLVSKMSKFVLGTRHYIFYRFGWFSLIKYQLGRLCNISKTAVIFRYLFWPLWDVLSWSVSYLGINYYAFTTSQTDWFYLRNNETSQRRHK